MKFCISSETSQKIKNMSLLCAFLVVSIHVIWPHEQPLSVGWFMYEALSEGIAKIGVPFFFIVSGFFLAQHFDEAGWYQSEVRKRINSLLIPFVCWAIIACLASMPMSIIADMQANRPFGTSIYFLQGNNWQRILGFDLTTYPLLGPLWYIRCLMLFVLTAFFFKSAIQKLGIIWLTVSFIFLLSQEQIPNENWREFFLWTYSASGVFYFSVGVFIHKHVLVLASNRIVKSSWMAILSGCVGLALLVSKLILVYNSGTFISALGKLSVPFLMFFVWFFMPSMKMPQWLTSCSFPIFLMHGIFLSYASMVLKRFPFSSLTCSFIQLVVGASAPILTALILRCFSQKGTVFLFGGR